LTAESPGLRGFGERNVAKPTTNTPDAEIPERMRHELECLPDACPHCNATIGPVEAKVWSEAAQTSNLALYVCPHCGHRWTCAWPTVMFWLDHKPTEVQTFIPPEPIAKTIDQRPIFHGPIDLSDTDQLPPDGDLNVRYTYLLSPSGKRVTGARRNFVMIRARWKDANGQRYVWKRTFEDRAAAMQFGGKHWSGIDETREWNRGLIMSLIP
jgi:DNA-directed RNA polymerase subunit RPC12/RpoP